MNRSFPALNLISRTLILAVLLAVLASCGGGGSGSSSSSLFYTTDWTNRGRAVTGLSQRVQLFDSQNRLKKSVIMNQDSIALQQIEFSSLSRGTYRLFVELFSQRDLGGVRTGLLELLVDVDGRTQFLSAVGKDPTSIVVTPANTTFEVDHSRQFYAAGFSSPGEATFIEADSVTWTTLGGTATINESGLAFGTVQGPGTARATHVPSGLQGSAVFTVQPLTTTTSKWTVLVFVNAANDLYPFATLNVNQMEKVAQNSDVRFVLQWKESKTVFPGSIFDGTRRYLVKPDLTDSIASELIQDLGDGVDMGDPDELKNFIQWGKAHYPAERYCLVIWNHGNGWRRDIDQLPSRAVSYDDETGNAIQIWEMAQALGSNVFDIVAFDASLMQMIEVATEIKDQAHFVAGSEESPPGEGYPYDLIFDNFRDNPDGSTLLLSKAFVDGMLEVPGYATRKITQSVVETSKLTPLENSLSALADQLIANKDAIAGVIPTIRATTQSYSSTSTRVYRDIDHLCQVIISQIGLSAVQTAATNVRTALSNAVVWEGHNSNSANSHGLSIDFSSGAQFGSSAADYALMRFAVGTSWNEWLLVAP